jgi:lipoprotein Spr
MALNRSQILFFICLAGLLQSCALFKASPIKKSVSRNSPFFDDISIALNPKGPKTDLTQDRSSSTIGFIEDKSEMGYLNDLQGIEYIPPVVFRYAVLLNIEVEKLTNKRLIEYVHQWWAVPYRIGGNSKEGIDCSAFVQGLSSEAFGLTLPRTSREQADFCKEISKQDLKEGDLVFFAAGRSISHVGMYISNNKFVHASTSMGVVISDLDEAYWSRRFVKAGRLL